MHHIFEVFIDCNYHVSMMIAQIHVIQPIILYVPIMFLKIRFTTPLTPFLHLKLPIQRLLPLALFFPAFILQRIFTQ